MSHAVAEAWRGLVRHRAFGGFVIAILALGAGSATALVGLTDVLLVRPPAHVADPERLVTVNGAMNYVLYREVARRGHALRPRDEPVWRRDLLAARLRATGAEPELRRRGPRRAGERANDALVECAAAEYRRDLQRVGWQRRNER